MNTYLDTARLDSIANRIDAAARLLECTGYLQEPAHRPVMDMAVRNLGIYVEAIRVANRMNHDAPVAPSASMRMDFAVALPSEPLDAISSVDLLDAYVCCHLGSVICAVRAISTIYLEHDNRAIQHVGDAMFEGIHWIEAARHELGGMLNQAVKFEVAA